MIFDEEQEKMSLIDMVKHHTVVAPCVYDCVSAKILEDTGFEALCLSGGELAASLVGVPDLGLVTQDELVGAVERINNCVKLPMIVDIDTGFGNELNIIRTCKRVAHAGAKAVHLEDQTSPKRCGHLQGKEVVSLDEYLGKIRAAAFALKGTGCALIARTDSYHTIGFDEAVKRCNKAIEAGADITFIEGCGTLEEIKKAGQLVNGLKMFAMLSTGASPKVTYEQCVEWGYNLVTMHFGMGGAIRGMRYMAKKCYEMKSDIPMQEFKEMDKVLGGKNFHDLFGMNDWLALGKTFNNNRFHMYSKQKCNEYVK